MASIKETKKDIKNITFEIASNCYFIMEEHPDKDLSEIDDLIDELLDLEEEALQKLNDRNKEANGKETRMYIKQMKNDFVNQSNEILDKINTKIEAIEKV